MSVWVWVILAIFVSIILGYTTKINIGFYALGFAYIIGCFGMGLKPKQVIRMWPMDIFFILFAVNFFYSFAISNGTLEKLALNILYRFRKMPAALPFVIFFVACLLSAMGAGFYAILAFIIPFTIIICDKTGMNFALGVVAAAGGAVSGGKFVISVSGKVMEALMQAAGYTAEESTHFVLIIFIVTTLMQLSFLLAIFLVTKSWKVGKADLEMQKPEPFTHKQRLNLYLIIALVVAMLGPYFLGIFVKSPVLTLIQAKSDIGFMSVIASMIALALKLGDEKPLLKALPWGTILMICSIGILIAMGVEGGLIEALAGSNMPSGMVPYIMTIIAGVMSIFSSTTGVVMPTLFPMVPALCAASTNSPALLFSAIAVGSLSTGMSPFSSGGGISMSACPTEESREKMLKVLFWLPPVGLLDAVIVVAILKLFM